METLEKAQELCPTNTMRRLAQGALLIDVRESDELAEAAFDLPALLHIPLSQLEDRWPEIPRDREVIFACREGVRSLKATYYLMNRGYTNVINMKHGMLRWEAKGFPMTGSLGAEEASGSCCSTAPAKHSTCC